MTTVMKCVVSLTNFPTRIRNLKDSNARRFIFIVEWPIPLGNDRRYTSGDGQIWVEQRRSTFLRSALVAGCSLAGADRPDKMRPTRSDAVEVANHVCQQRTSYVRPDLPSPPCRAFHHKADPFGNSRPDDSVLGNRRSVERHGYEKLGDFSIGHPRVSQCIGDCCEIRKHTRRSFNASSSRRVGQSALTATSVDQPRRMTPRITVIQRGCFLI